MAVTFAARAAGRTEPGLQAGWWNEGARAGQPDARPTIFKHRQNRWEPFRSFTGDHDAQPL